MGRWACFGLRGLRDRGAKGKGWRFERAEIEGRKMALRGGEWSGWKVECEMWNVECWVLDVR